MAVFKDTFRMHLIPFLVGIAFLVLWAVYVFGTPGVIEGKGGNPIGRDYFNFFTGGRAALSGQVDWIYDRVAYAQHTLSQDITDLYNFSYPPHALLALSAFGALPYKIGFVFWAFGSLAAYIFVMRPHLLRVSRDTALLAIFSPAVLISFYWGQTGMWVAALLGGGLLLSPHHPVKAGILLGVLTVKPQLGLIVPILLLCTRQWVTIASALATTLLLVAASFMIFGRSAWSAFLTDTTSYQFSIAGGELGLFDYMVYTPFRSLVLLDVPSDIALTLHGMFAFGIAASVGLYSLRGGYVNAVGVGLISTAVISPYFASYDLTVISMGAIIVWPKISKWSRSLLVAAIISPALLTTSMLGLPPAVTTIGTIAIVGAIICTWIDLYRPIKSSTSKRPA